MPAEQHLRHDKHWRYVSQHTVKFWVQSFTSDLRKFTKSHGKLRCHDLGLGLDNFRVIALTENFCKLDVSILEAAYSRQVRLDSVWRVLSQQKTDPQCRSARLQPLTANVECL